MNLSRRSGSITPNALSRFTRRQQRAQLGMSWGSRIGFGFVSFYVPELYDKSITRDKVHSLLEYFEAMQLQHCCKLHYNPDSIFLLLPAVWNLGRIKMWDKTLFWAIKRNRLRGSITTSIWATLPSGSSGIKPAGLNLTGYFLIKVIDLVRFGSMLFWYFRAHFEQSLPTWWSRPP